VCPFEKAELSLARKPTTIDTDEPGDGRWESAGARGPHSACKNAVGLVALPTMVVPPKRRCDSLPAGPHDVCRKLSEDCYIFEDADANLRLLAAADLTEEKEKSAGKRPSRARDRR